MTYATLTALLDRAGEVEIRQISDRDRRGEIDPEVVDAALRDADTLIDGYIRVKYAPLEPPFPDLVKSWAVSIARYFLHRNGAPKNVTDDYHDAVASLKDVARGALVLPVQSGASAPAIVGGQVLASHPPRVFTAAKLQGWR